MAYVYMAEVWSEFAVAVIVVLLRFYVRWSTVGLRKCHSDDYLMIFCLILLMLLSVYRVEISKRAHIKVGPNVPQHNITERQTSQHYDFAAWITVVTYFWCLKGCLLLMYGRILRNLNTQRAVKFTAAFVVLSYAGCILEVCLHCLPIQRQWVVYPVQVPHCQTSNDNFLTVGLLNVLTDLALFGIAVSVLWQVRLPMRKKAIMALVLCSGLFSIVATVIRNTFSYLIEFQTTGGNFSINAVHAWASRETFTAIVVVNLPALRPLISSSKWVSSITGSSRKKSSPSGGDSTDATASTSRASTAGKGRIGSVSAGFFRKYGAKQLGMSTIGNTYYEEEKRPTVVALAVPEPALHPNDNRSKSNDIDLEATAPDRQAESPSPRTR